MATDKPQVWEVDAVDPDSDIIDRAARVIRDGGLVAFPTETVYGLGANALDAGAVEKIFEAKQRPPNNPLIVHIADTEDARDLVRDWPEDAQRLAEAFWPGPLSMVLPRAGRVPKVVTAGLDTVGVRLPAHPVARALIRAAERPISAPSANLYTGVSPTSARHVERALGPAVDVILDAGPTRVGIESTVVRLDDGGITILRPGMVTAGDLERVVDRVDYLDEALAAGRRRESPGLAPKHYSPSCELVLADDVRVALEGDADDEKVGWMFVVDPGVETAGPSYAVGETPERYAERLYAVLHDLDHRGVRRIIAERPPTSEPWRGIADRLSRASA
ncbi:MAG: L-threonylcarbamoyladenylate synthase [Myxococcota bacterium]